MIQKHVFKGRTDRWCETCNLPDRHPIHDMAGPDIVVFDQAQEAINKAAEMPKLYIIHSDGYMHEQPSMSEFRGTYRELLYHILEIDPATEAENAIMPFKLIPSGLDIEEGDPEYYKPYKQWSEEELVALFEHGNGDGQPYWTIWCVDDHKQTLG